MRARKLSYTIDALNDLREIRGYIAEQASPRLAAKMITRLREAIRAAREAPLSGTPRSEFRATCRFALERPYLIYYDFDGSTLTVLRVLHKSRDRDTIMKSDG